MTPGTPFHITVANGEHLKCSNLIDRLTWSMAGRSFSATVNVIPLGGYDLILGVEWLSYVSPVTFDDSQEIVTIKWEKSKGISLRVLHRL